LKKRFDKDVNVTVDTEVTVEVFCSECGEQLEIEEATAQKGTFSYQTGDHITIQVKPHACKPEE